MIKILILNFLWYQISQCYLMDYSQSKMLTIGDAQAYFGFSILLQSGKEPVAIVGAPNKKLGSQNMGAVYKCNLASDICVSYSRISTVKGIYPPGKNSYFLGSIIKGENTEGGLFITCAPRFIEFIYKNYYLNGRCFMVPNSLQLNTNGTVISPLRSQNQVSTIGLNSFYDAAFGEAGFDMIYDNKMVIMGAPGKTQFHGILIESQNNVNRYFPISYNLEKDSYSYFGYAVASGKFLKKSSLVWYVAGGPKGAELKGRVLFFSSTSQRIVQELGGEVFGSYFGASLLVIDKNGNGDDILIGAPMYSGNSYDEGCVFYYKNIDGGTFSLSAKLTTQKTLARFGTSMSLIGDIDLDGFIDCAISAPYEDNGIGAVYIYFGSKNGFSNDLFYRVSPSSLPHQVPIRGFGLGISNAVDIDNNGHNDLVIGAYKSGQIFTLLTNELFDINASFVASPNFLYTTSKLFSVKFCIKFRCRNGNRNRTLDLTTHIIMDDDKILNSHYISRNITLKAIQETCLKKTIYLNQNVINMDPLNIVYGYRVSGANISDNQTLKIPILYECGSDNICHTDLRLRSFTPNNTKIIFGLNKEININIRISNYGESAYQTKLYVKLPPEISLGNARECEFNNESYVCQISRALNGTVDKTFVLDLANLQIDMKHLPIFMKIESVGDDLDLKDNELNLVIPVSLQSTYMIKSQAEPETVSLNVSKEFLNITHSFSIFNNGPSPSKINVTILVPDLKTNTTNLPQIEKFEAVVDNMMLLNCAQTTKFVVPQINDHNDTETLNCFSHTSSCVAIKCFGEFFLRSEKYATFTLKLNLRTEFIGKMLEDKKNRIKFVSTAFFTNGTEQFVSNASTLILASSESSGVSVAVYIGAVVFGFILLFLLIFILYKCNFFKRKYKEKKEAEEETNAEQQLINESGNTSQAE